MLETMIGTPALNLRVAAGTVVGRCLLRCRGDVLALADGCAYCDRCGAEYRVAFITQLEVVP